SCLQSSRVKAAPRGRYRLERVPVGWPKDAFGRTPTPESERATPRFVLVPPAGGHLLVDWGSQGDERDAAGAFLRPGKKVSDDYDLTVDDDGYYFIGAQGLWKGGDGPVEKPGVGYSDGGSTLAFRIDGERRTIVSQISPNVDPHATGSWDVEVYAERFAK